MLRLAARSVLRRQLFFTRALKTEEVDEVDISVKLSPMDSWQPVPFELDDDDLAEEFEYPPQKFKETKKVMEADKTKKGSFSAAKFQGFGNTDYLDEMYWPEWRTGYFSRDRYYSRINNPNLTEVHQAYWAVHDREIWEAEKHMDLRWNQYIDEFGYAPDAYFETDAFRAKYGDDEKVWFSYFRSQKGPRESQMAREACFNPAKTSLNACPLHRDYQLLVHYKNLPLLKQFMCPTMGNIMSPLRTGICLQAHLELEVALTLAWQKGYLLQPIHHYRPANGWDTGRSSDDLEEMVNIDDKLEHFRELPRPTDKL